MIASAKQVMHDHNETKSDCTQWTPHFQSKITLKNQEKLYNDLSPYNAHKKKKN
jgi:hypothetical protein